MWLQPDVRLFVLAAAGLLHHDANKSIDGHAWWWSRPQACGRSNQTARVRDCDMDMPDELLRRGRLQSTLLPPLPRRSAEPEYRVDAPESPGDRARRGEQNRRSQHTQPARHAKAEISCLSGNPRLCGLNDRHVGGNWRWNESSQAGRRGSRRRYRFRVQVKPLRRARWARLISIFAPQPDAVRARGCRDEPRCFRRRSARQDAAKHVLPAGACSQKRASSCAGESVGPAGRKFLPTLRRTLLLAAATPAIRLRCRVFARDHYRRLCSWVRCRDWDYVSRPGTSRLLQSGVVWLKVRCASVETCHLNAAARAVRDVRLRVRGANHVCHRQRRESRRQSAFARFPASAVHLRWSIKCRAIRE